MFKYLLVLLIFVCGSATAGYKGKNAMEMSRTADPFENKFSLYSQGLGDQFTRDEPICHERKQMFVTLYTGEIVIGCWWRIGDQLYGYTRELGVSYFNMDLMTVNDNFTGQEPKGF